MQVFGSNELFEDVHKRDLCIGCGACVSLCPYFKNYRGKTARIFPCTLDQGRCHAYCPKTEVDLNELSQWFSGKAYDGSPLGVYQEIVTARAGGNAPKGAFQTGGAVSAIIAHAIENGMIDAAVLTGRKDMTAVPCLVEDVDGVIACAGSKYMAAPTLAAFNRGVASGKTRLGMVGVPCQITALSQIRINPFGKQDFIDPSALVVGLFCTWALDTRRFTPLVDECADSSCISGMDLPPPPSEIMVIDTGGNKVEIPLERIRPLIPKACRMCPDMTAEFSDLSVGVLEGTPGVNTLIIRTEKGRDLVNSAQKAGYLITGEMPAANLENLTKAAANKKKQGFANANAKGLLNTPPGDGRAVMRAPEEIVARIINS